VKRFSSKTAPTVIEFKYRECLTIEEHGLCNDDVVEAFTHGQWRHGTIMKVTKDRFDFRDSMGKEHLGIEPAHVRPWPRRMLLKPDGIASDMTCFCMFRIFNYLCRHSFIPAAFIPCALDVEVLPAGPQFGFMEYIENCRPACNYDWPELYNFSDKQLQVFLRTAAGSLIAGHVVGIGDRHQDNIMLREVELPNIGSCIQFFQLDFKHYLGQRAKIDASSIAIPQKMKEVLQNMVVDNLTWEEEDAESPMRMASGVSGSGGLLTRFDELVTLCGMAFRVLRRSSGFVMHFIRILTQDSEYRRVWESYLTESLCLSLKEEDAVHLICQKVRTSSRTLAKFVKDVAHSKKRVTL